MTVRLGSGTAAGNTCRAGPAAAVDLADDAASLPRTGLGHADELVSQDSAEPHVAANQLQVGFADAGARDANEDFAVTRRGNRIIGLL